MTVLSSKEGKFYDVPEDVLNKHELPAERVNEILAEFDSDMGAPARSGPVTIYVTGEGAYIEPSAPAASGGDVEPYAHHHHHGHHHGGWGGWGGWGPGPYVPPPWVFFPRRRYW